MILIKILTDFERSDQLNWIEVGIRFVRVEDFIAVHHRDQVLGVGEVDDVMRIAWEHVNHLDVVAAYLKLDDLIRSQSSHLVWCQCCPLVMPGLLMLMLT